MSKKHPVMAKIAKRCDEPISTVIVCALIDIVMFYLLLTAPQAPTFGHYVYQNIVCFMVELIVYANYTCIIIFLRWIGALTLLFIMLHFIVGLEILNHKHYGNLRCSDINVTIRYIKNAINDKNGILELILSKESVLSRAKRLGKCVYSILKEFYEKIGDLFARTRKIKLLHRIYSISIFVILFGATFYIVDTIMLVITGDLHNYVFYCLSSFLLVVAPLIILDYIYRLEKNRLIANVISIFGDSNKLEAQLNDILEKILECISMVPK